MTLNDLPAVNATLNGLAAIFLTAGFVFIRRKNKIAHRNCMLSAVGCSALFLVSYLTYHFGVHGVTKFKDPAWFRPFYFAILFSHLVLAIAILPMVVVTMTHALRERFDRHKKIARWTWPIWMYVSITGVIIYLLLYQIFPQK